MDIKSLIRRIDRELIEAHVSAEFWRKQLPLHTEDPLKSTVKRSLENALSSIEHLEAAKKAARSA